MLLTRCAYCQGTGKQKCVCRVRKPSSRAGSGTETAEGCGEEAQVLLQPAETEEMPDYSCALCRDSGWMTCPGCSGSGYVEMPALA